jgi:PKD repeat protein
MENLKISIGTDFEFNKTELKTGIMKRILISTAAAAVIMLSSCEVQPESYFFSDKIKAEVGEDVFFYNGSNNAIDYEWDFGDGTWSDAYEPVHSYNGSGIFTVVLSAYTRNGNVDRSYLDIEVVSKTMLEVEVLEYYDQYPVEGASVILYPTESDWDNETNAIVEGFTNASGKVIFTNLQARVYYVDVWHETHNNYTLRNEDVGFIRTDQLYSNELNQFIAWVDYTGAKGIATRDRKQLLPLKSRTAEATLKK